MTRSQPASQVSESGALVEIPEQQAVIRLILALRREGLSLRVIAGIISGAVSHVTVKNILDAEMQVEAVRYKWCV
jgi:hypothetical protein